MFPFSMVLYAGATFCPHEESKTHFSFIQGLAKFVEWSANMMEEDAKRRLKAAELQAKKSRLRIWTNYVPPATNSKAIHDQNFTGKVGIWCKICVLMSSLVGNWQLH